ncbi:MAG: hypothetical protein QM724_10880 [Flavobacteriales bacterium]
MAARYIIELTDQGRRQFWEELLAQLDFVKVQQPAKPKPLRKTKKEKEFQDGLRAAIQEMKDNLSGKKKLPSLKEALDELRG